MVVLEVSETKRLQALDDESSRLSYLLAREGHIRNCSAFIRGEGAKSPSSGRQKENTRGTFSHDHFLEIWAAWNLDFVSDALICGRWDADRMARYHPGEVAAEQVCRKPQWPTQRMHVSTRRCSRP